MSKKLILLSLLLIFCTLALTFPIEVRGDDQITRVVDLLNIPTIAIEEQPNQLPEDVLVIINGTIIDGTGRDPITDGLVAMQGEQILAVGQEADFTIPAGAQIIDAAQQTILPGIINAHVHNTQSAGTRSRFLDDGVTSTCDMATSLDEMAHFAPTDNEPGQLAANGFKSGPMITAPAGYPSQHGIHWDYQVSTPQEATAATNDLLDHGADMIKIALEPWLPNDPWPTLTLTQVKAVVDTAHARNVPVRAHVQQASMLDAALQAGVDSVEHVPLPFPEEMTLAEMGPETQLSLADYPELEAQLADMAKQGIALVPTLNVGTCAMRGMPELETPAHKEMCDFQLEIVSQFHAMGGTVVLGNDYGNPGVEQGMPLKEMSLLSEAGLTPMEIIEAGTRHAADICGHGDELGTLEAGKQADVLVVAGDPLQSIQVLDNVSLVIQAGKIVNNDE